MRCSTKHAYHKCSSTIYCVHHMSNMTLTPRAVDKYISAADDTATKKTEALVTQYGKVLAKLKDAAGLPRHVLVLLD